VISILHQIAGLRRLAVVGISAASLLFPSNTNATMAQEITFAPISNRTTGQALSFIVSPSASSGLPVSLTATGTCAVSGLTVSVLDKGTCTITATQAGNEDWAAATPVSQSFAIARVLLSNKTLTFRTADGELAKGLKIKWHTPDSSYSSTSVLTTNNAGQVKYSKIPGGAIIFEWWGTAGIWRITEPENLESTELLIGSATSVITVGPGLDQYPTDLQAHVELENGQPVVGAQVVAVCNYNCQYLPWTERNDYSCLAYPSNWALTTCVREQKTDLLGNAKLRVPKRNDGTGYRAFASFTDGDLSQSTPLNGWGNNFESGLVTVVFDQLPVVDMETEPATVDYGVAQTITALALDSDGSPIPGRVLTLTPSTGGASASCTGCSQVVAAAEPDRPLLAAARESGRRSVAERSEVFGASSSCTGLKTVATTNSAGRATFKVCPVKTATWSVDGRSIVGSSGVRLTVQLTPTAPRTPTATSKTRSVALAWVAPVKANAGSVTDYIVQYRLQGATTWITFRDGTSTVRKATVTGLTSGQIYEFRVAAKNKSGTGTWSDVVLGTPN